MIRLIPFELGKVWRKRSFLLAVCALLALHGFLLWYTTIPEEGAPPLSAYGALQRELSGKSEEEKGKYMEAWKEELDGICFVREILSMEGAGGEMGRALAKQEREAAPGLFEAYCGRYESGDYLRFTDSLDREKALLDEVYEEWRQVAGYGDYLRSVQEDREILGGISVFGGGEEGNDSYGRRNLIKSAEDYEGLDAGGICFTPARGIAGAMESPWTDLLLFLSVLLFVGTLITEEKEKGLFFVTRSTKKGILPAIGAKLAALLVHCLLLTLLFYLVSLGFFGYQTGGFPAGAPLQSLAPYLSANLPLSIGEYLFLSAVWKALVLFGTGACLTAASIRSGIAVLPFLAGAGLAGGSEILYRFLPAGTSSLSMAKYLNPAGLLKTEKLFGGYLNFNLSGLPVSRLLLSFLVLSAFGAVGVTVSLGLFARMKHFGARRLRVPVLLPFKPHTSLLRHEGYKLLIVNQGLLFFLLFAVLLGAKGLGRSYIPSVGEEYYRKLMLSLEGPLTEEKEAVILEEKERYAEAFKTMELLDGLAGDGKIGEEAADALRAQASMTLSFYPAFERVERQYLKVKEGGGRFVYDTGYLYLFGLRDDSLLVDGLILFIGVILMVSGAIPVEEQTGAWPLLQATRVGKRRILIKKAVIGGGMAAALALTALLCRSVRIASVYPMGEIGAAIQSLPRFSGIPVPMPIAAFILLFAFSQAAVSVIAAMATLGLSLWRKNQAQTVFFGFLFLVLPLTVLFLI